MKKYNIQSVFFILLFGLGFAACEKDSDPRSEYANRKFVRINKTTVSIQMGENCTVKAKFDSEQTAKQKFAWKVLDETIADIVQENDSTAIITGIKVGSTTISIESVDGKLKHFATVHVRRVFELTCPIYIDFGPHETNPPFNNFKDNRPNASIASLLDEDGNDTDYSFTTAHYAGFLVFDWMPTANAYNYLGIPVNAAGDAFFNDALLGERIDSSGFIISNLKKSQNYSVYFYGFLDSNDNIETKYHVKGKNEGIVVLNLSWNRNQYVVVENISPNNDAQISITMKPGPNNNIWSGFYGVSVIIITPVGYPNPFPLNL